MRPLSALLLLGLIAFALASPLGIPRRPECGMACCRLAAARHASCASTTTCALTACNHTGTVADLPSLPVSTLPIPPRVDGLAVAGPLASDPEASVRSFPSPLPERPPRA